MAKGPLCGPGSKGSDGSEGSEGGGIALRAMSFKISLREMENQTTGPSARRKCTLIPLRGLLHGKACHWILRSLCSPTNPVPLPPWRERFALCSAFISYVMNSISENQPPPAALTLWCLRHHLPPAVRSGAKRKAPLWAGQAPYFARLAHPMQDVHSGTIKLR